MISDGKNSRKWTLEEIDELLQDSGMLPRDFNSPEDVEEVAPTPKKSSFNPRPTRNESIKHKIISEKVERSDGDAEPQVYGNFASEKYRERFSDKTDQIIAKTVELSAENSTDGGAFKTKSNFAKTGNFNRITENNKKTTVINNEKTVVIDNEVHQKTTVLRSLAVTENDEYGEDLYDAEGDAQLSFEGFHTTEDNVDHIDEAQVEAELLEKRKEVVTSFAISSDIPKSDGDDSPKLYGTDEYRTTDDRYKVRYYLKKKKSSAFTGAVTAFLCAFLLMVISLISVNSGYFAVPLIIVSIIVTLVAAGVNFPFILDGIKSVKNFKFDKNTGCFIALVGSLIQSIIILFCENPFETGVGLFSASAVFALGINVAGEYFEIKRIFKNFEYIASNKELYSVNYIDNKSVATEIAKGLLIDEPKVLSSQKTDFPLRFIELSRKTYPSDSICRRLVPLSLAVSTLIGVITLIISKDIRNAVASFSACLCVSLPYFSSIADSFAITSVSDKLLKKGAMISGWSSLKLCKESNAIIVDSRAVFDENCGDVSGIHSFYDMSVDEAIIYASTLTIASGGPAGNIFKRVIVGDTSMLPPVDSLTYEDKLGLSAWIFNRRVLVGSEALLINHNVEIPDTRVVKKRLEKEGGYPLYLAVDGKAAAVFIINYGVDEKNRKFLYTIESNSISILLRADDANITDSMVAESLSVDESGVKVISAVSGETYKNYIKETTTAADSYLLHDGGTSSFLAAIWGALSLEKIMNLVKTLQIVACGIGVAVVAVLSFVSGLHSLNSVSLIILQAVFTAVSLALTASNVLKNKKIQRNDL